MSTTVAAAAVAYVIAAHQHDGLMQPLAGEVIRFCVHARALAAVGHEYRCHVLCNSRAFH